MNTPNLLNVVTRITNEIPVQYLTVFMTSDETTVMNRDCRVTMRAFADLVELTASSNEPSERSRTVMARDTFTGPHAEQRAALKAVHMLRCVTIDTRAKIYFHEATELHLYIINDAAVFNAYFVPACRALEKHYVAGRFNRDRGIRALLRVATAAAKQYNLEHGSMSTAWNEVFPLTARERVASELLDYYLDARKTAEPFWQ
jgi:hypothetical protein